MIQAADQFALALEALEHFRFVGHGFVHHLDYNCALHAYVVSQIKLGHASLGKMRIDQVFAVQFFSYQ